MAFDQLRHRWLAGPWAIWGKLPTHGDFLRHRTTAAQARDWQDWVSRVWDHRPGAAVGEQRHAVAWITKGKGMLPHRAPADLADVPVAFVMQPGALPFAPRHALQGVMVASSDQSGRPCPLVVFQQVAPRWLRRCWTRHEFAHRDGDVLYWLARLAARVHAAPGDWPALAQAVDALGDLYPARWRHGVGAPIPRPSRAQVDTVLRGYCDDEATDTASDLRGVKHMPWMDWPTRIVRTRHPVHAFWQQDVLGGYVNAGEDLTHFEGGVS